MGMYDRVWLVCPKCGSQIEWQSKAGECHLADYSLFDAPPAILGDIAGEHGVCKCGFAFIIVVQMMASIQPYNNSLERTPVGDPRRE